MTRRELFNRALGAVAAAVLPWKKAKVALECECYETWPWTDKMYFSEPNDPTRFDPTWLISDTRHAQREYNRLQSAWLDAVMPFSREREFLDLRRDQR